MAISEAQQKAVNKYVKNNYDRINVTFPKGEKIKLQTHAKAKGESVNAFIIRAVKETMEREKPIPSKPVAAKATDTSSVDLSRLSSDIMYQFEVRDAFGDKVLAELIEKAHNKATNEPNTTRKEV